MSERNHGPKTYKDMLKELHPECYSDSVVKRDATLVPEFLGFFLDTLTSKNKEHEFEGFCRQMVRLRICPNLIVQTGPTGGGDSKVDTETFPVDSGLAEAWLPAESVTAAGERWAFAISAKREWQQKVRSDVLKIKEVEDSLHRGYARVFFISNQLISDKKRAETEDKLRSESGFDVRILDRNWLVETALSSPESRLATIRELGMSESLLDDRKTGARDSARETELAEIESRIQTISPDMWRERIRLADRAAELICELERPDYEITNALNRHLNLAQDHGDLVQKSEALYLFVYRTVANCEEPDDTSVCRRYAEFEEAVLSDKSKINISRLITLWMVLATRHRVGLSKFDESAHADVIDRIIEELSQDENRRSTYFEVALRYQPMRLVRGAAPSDVLAESKSLLESAAGIASVDFSVLTALFDISDDFVEEPLFDQVAELLYWRTKEEEGARTLAPSLLKRGRKLSESGRHYDAITQMTRALTCLRGAQDRLDFIAACLELAQECYNVEFIWASRCLCRMALSLSFDAYYGDGVLTPAMLVSCHMLKNFELRSGNLQGAVRPDERDRPAPCRRGGARGLRRRCGRAPLREARHHRLVAGAGPKRRDLRGRQPPGAGAVARRGFRRSATFRPTAPRGGATSTSPSGSLRHLAAPRSSSGAPNPRLLNPHRLHVDLPRNRFDRQSFTCDVVKLEYTYPQQVHRRNALTRTVGTNPSSESRRMLRAGGGRPERHLRAVRLERDGTQRTTSACSRGK